MRYGVYETSDHGFVTLGALEEKFWSRFCQLIGRPDWEEDDLMAPEEDVGRKEELKRLFRSKTTAEWSELGLQKDVCLFPVREVELRSQDQKKKAPPLGHHAAKILKSLGYRRDQIRSLKLKRVIE